MYRPLMWRPLGSGAGAGPSAGPQTVVHAYERTYLAGERVLFLLMILLCL